ncbi:RNA demethylase ALKBH9B-like isoform X2 [Neltuma alba]|uniref:RNA demethylase ALKBH9B-like isoform X2 n=1 Tax=Neltuma alba TaxID=207710 RepID=UPI0010A3DAEA|nr:RNA demethylase ALKBH9B-like isoform X2 [Prosopis alba]
MEFLESLNKEQILQMLSDTFCNHCEARLHQKISNLCKRNHYETSHAADDDDYYGSSRHTSYKSRNGRYYETPYAEDDDDYYVSSTDASYKSRNGKYYETPLAEDEDGYYVSSTDASHKSRNGKHYETSYADNDDYAYSRDAYFHSRNGDALVVHHRNHREEEDSTRSYIQRHETPWLRKHDNRLAFDSTPKYLNRKRQSIVPSDFELLLSDGIGGASLFECGLSEEQKEHIRFSLVGRKKNFVYIERIGRRDINVLHGLELHNQVFNPEEQRNIIKYVDKLQEMGQKGQFKECTYSEPRKWMRGKGRVTIQFGCCYNYAIDRHGNPPGILRQKEADPLPNLFKKMIKRMVRWHILPPTCIPNSCVVNIYDEGDCIPPHIDHHDFVRPFSTVSFLSECDILFGSNLKVVSPGEFQGPVRIALPVGSVFIFNGNGADVAKHCIPSVPTKRISITFRRMDDSKLPSNFSPDPELESIKPLDLSSSNKTEIEYSENKKHKTNSV